MKLNFLIRQQAERSTPSPNRFLVVLLAFVAMAWAVNYLLAPQWPWQTELSEESGFITRVDLTRVFIEELSADREPAIVVQLVNTSKSSAQAVSLALGETEANVPSAASKMLTTSTEVTFSIDSGQRQKIVVVPLSGLLSMFQSQCPGCFFLGVGKERSIPIDVLGKLCKVFLEKGHSCHMEYDLFPIVLTTKFKAVSGEEFSGKNSVFVYLSRAVRTEYSVPKN